MVLILATENEISEPAASASPGCVLMNGILGPSQAHRTKKCILIKIPKWLKIWETLGVAQTSVRNHAGHLFWDLPLWLISKPSFRRSMKARQRRAGGPGGSCRAFPASHKPSVDGEVSERIGSSTLGVLWVSWNDFKHALMNGLVDTEAEREGGMNWESTCDIQALSCVKHSSREASVEGRELSCALWWPRGMGRGWGGRRLKREEIYGYIQLSHTAVEQRPTQHWKAITLQFKKKNFKCSYNIQSCHIEHLFY